MSVVDGTPFRRIPGGSGVPTSNPADWKLLLGRGAGGGRVYLLPKRLRYEGAGHEVRWYSSRKIGSMTRRSFSSLSAHDVSWISCISCIGQRNVRRWLRMKQTQVARQKAGLRWGAFIVMRKATAIGITFLHFLQVFSLRFFFFFFLCVWVLC